MTFHALMDKPTRVLIAEDHPVLRAGLKQILLAEADIELAGEATNSSEALDLAQRTDPDVVILDLTLPGSSGLELLKHLKREYPTIPVLVISAHGEDQFAAQVLKAGGAGYLCNDTAPESLVAAVRKIVGGGKYVSAALAEQLAQKTQEDVRLLQHDGDVAFGHGADRNACDFLHRRDIDDRHVVGHRVGDVGSLAVWRERHPAGPFASEFGAAKRLQVGQRGPGTGGCSSGCRRRVSCRLR